MSNAVGAAVFVVVVVAACLSPSGTMFKATVRQPDGSYPLEVVLDDYTGKVTGIEAASEEAAGGDSAMVQSDPADVNAVTLTWATGACDDVSIAFRRSDEGYRLDVDADERIGLGCTAQLLIRRLRVRFSEPISANEITASGGR